MNKAIGILTLVVFIQLFLSLTCVAQTTEQLDITTYYPSPTGVYRTLRLFPTATPDPTAGCSPLEAGDMYYHSGTSQSYVCNGTVWQSLGSLWTLNGNDLSPNNLNWNIKVNSICISGDCRNSWPASTCMNTPPESFSGQAFAGMGVHNHLVQWRYLDPWMPPASADYLPITYGPCP